MADSRIKDLDGEVSSGQIQALLATLYLAVDATSFTDAKKLLLQTILTNAVISSNANNYQAMTPKAFYDSVMTTVVMGINRMATDGEITAKTGSGLLTAANQVLMNATLKNDFFVGNFVPNTYRVNATGVDPQSGNSLMGAMAYSVTAEADINTGQKVVFSPVLPSGRSMNGISCRGVFAAENTPFFFTAEMVYAGNYEVEVVIKNFSGTVDIFAIGTQLNGTQLYIRKIYNFNTPSLKLSMSVNVTMTIP